MNKIKGFMDKHSTFVMLFPYASLFTLFVIIPVIAAMVLSFTDFNSVSFPKFLGMDYYVQLFTNDSIFMQKILPNTIIFALFVGIGGYALGFVLAWCLSQITKLPRTILAIIIYLPSMTGGILIKSVWSVIFNGDKSGYLNYILLKLGWIAEPIAWLQSETYLLPIMIIVSLWSSMGVGFLAMLSGMLNINQELYEAGYIDGIKNRFQEIIYITIPSTKPQMLFGAIMAIVSTFQNGNIGVTLSGANPTPNYAGQLIVTHIEDFGYLRYEMGYAATISVVLLIVIFLISKGAEKLFESKDE